MVALIVLALVALVVWQLPYGRSPLRLIDPSYGSSDAAMCESLERALNGGVDPPPGAGKTGYDMALQLGPMSAQEFRRRIETVHGWEQLVVYPPYQLGEQLPLDPSISSWWLKRQIRRTDGLPQEGFVWVLVVRDQQVVGSLFLETDVRFGGVVTRSP